MENQKAVLQARSHALGLEAHVLTGFFDIISSRQPNHPGLYTDPFREQLD
jgi:hypothetical protein